MSTPLVTHETHGATLLLTLQRPDVRNALNADLVDALKHSLGTAATDDAVRAIVLRGAGSDFCAGADLKVLREISSRSLDENRADSMHLASLFKAIHLHPKPVIAAVHGNALAGGCGLACVCDVVVASDASTFGFTESRIGFVAAIVARFLIDRVGMGRARDLLLSGRRFDTAAAQAMGLVDHAVPADDVVDAALEQARQLAKCAGSSLELTKRLLAELPGKSLDEALEYAAGLNAETRATSDCREGVSAFLEKRKPRWLA